MMLLKYRGGPDHRKLKTFRGLGSAKDDPNSPSNMEHSLESTSETL